MEKKRYQCTFCGMQSDAQKPSVNNCLSKYSSKHDWIPMDIPIKDPDYWRCLYCGRTPIKCSNIGYPISDKCHARRIQLSGCFENLACVWVRLNGPEKNRNEWICSCCGKNPSTNEMQNNGLPKPTACPKNYPHNHIWKRIIKTRR